MAASAPSTACRDHTHGGVVARGRARHGAAHAVEQRLVRLLLHDGPPHVEAQDVVGALPDGVDLRVAQDAGDRPLLDVAVAAVHLDGVAGRGDAEPRGAQLDQRRADAQPAAR